MNRKTLLLITIFVEGGLMVLGLILVRLSRLALQPRVEITWIATASAFLLCSPLIIVLFLFDRSNLTPIARFRNQVEENVTPIFAYSKLPDIVLIAFLAGVSEELFFRGWLQGLLTDRFGIWLGILLTSIIFGLLHYLSATYAIYAGLTGLYLGVVYLLSGNLFIVMTVHALYDFIALAYLLRRGKRPEGFAP